MQKWHQTIYIYTSTQDKLRITYDQVARLISKIY